MKEPEFQTLRLNLTELADHGPSFGLGYVAMSARRLLRVMDEIERDSARAKDSPAVGNTDFAALGLVGIAPVHLQPFQSFAMDVLNRALDSSDGALYMHLADSDAELYRNATLAFGPLVADRFPSASYDIEEAAKCLALGRTSASVFHLMRVTEIAMHAVAKCLGAVAPSNPNWGAWLREIKKAIDAKSVSGAQKWVERDEFQEIFFRIDAVKDAHRNPTLHVEKIYTEEQAAEVFSASKAFIQKVSSRMNQDGLPAA